MYPRPIEKASAFTNISYRVALPISIVLWLLPLIAVMATSVRSLDDINQGNYWGWPSEWMLIENYTQVFTSTPMFQYLLNSLIITLPAVAGCVALSTMAGFALAKYNFKANIWIFATFIAGNFVPFQILMIPVRDLTIQFGLYDTHWALILFHIAFQTGFCTLFMRNFIVGLPTELIESARVEGVSEFKIFWHIVLPLVKPATAALAVLVFTFIWNDFFWALVLVQSDEVRPVTAGLSALQGQWLASWQLISAGAVVAALPPVILFFTMQRHFIAGLTLGATKG
ncbi:MULTISPECIES: carbohydrate ABC transporter permease [unclassified Agarivorans]|uniref:carbohydrate ABC transporter permease n=1 Tax=unclassified Agarivorans TaxID=2636026 RepID=UPI0010D84EBD|nr:MULTISPECIES: carbohydrate ABC transporter permease [unclassified Agarivorans]MDO6686704.1 carbohydrate ABC transporter permease [Agarivorans sp. 3_MG-2023]MDO6716566.1 carbohydrate ABC transporter permease [Agarivorans sp. 2_MG-2023]MDO6765504.1 carbohydrate ABC transporter permease [Agarivorans sp. 1_MG-2023]GDY26668.1 ABC transporter permease [Agarivorans sp. Toyoura001]